MKSKLKISAAIVLFLASGIAFITAQVPGAAIAINRDTGLPVQTVTPPTFDPMTGAMIPQAVPDWKDDKWKDPDITLTNVDFQNLPLSEIGRWLSDQFKQQFDVLLPGTASGIAYINNQTVPTAWQHDWTSEQVSLRLKNVTASEIFAAMNLLFENNRTPLRWDLKLNGHRQIALLRVLIDPTPQIDTTAPLPGQEKQRRIFFVGNLIGDDKQPGMTMEDIIKTVTDVWQMADVSGGNIKFHKEAELLVVTGTPSQMDFMEQTLKALGQKVDHERLEHMPTDPKPADTKPTPARR